MKKPKNDKKRQEEFDVLQRVHSLVCIDKRNVKDGEWSNSDIDYINTMQLLTAKPVVYLCNLGVEEYLKKSSKWMPLIEEWIHNFHQGSILIPFSGALETNLAELDESELKPYLKELALSYGITDPKSALKDITLKGYSSLQLIHCIFCSNSLNSHNKILPLG